MKSYDELKAEMEQIQQEMVELKNQETVQVLFSILNAEYIPDQVEVEAVFSSDFYTSLHQNNSLYQENNWFPDKYIELLQRKNIKSCFELGSGNGKATQKLSKFMQSYISVDFNPNPFSHLENVTCYEGSFFEVPDDVKTEITISADVLEHFPPTELSDAIQKLNSIAPLGFHIIAGYPDGMSHLSVFGPWKWLELFRQVDKKYKLLDIEFRRGRLDQPVYVLSNFD